MQTWLVVRKETRALAPAWLAGAVIILTSRIDARAWPRFDEAAYVLAAAALGALSVGHEYGYGTLGLTLTLPVRRERMLAMKFAVLLGMLLTLSGLEAPYFLTSRPEYARPILVMALPWALFVAPWLTMICRSAIAGTVFAIALPAALLLVGERIGIATYGYSSKVDTFSVAVLLWGTVISCSAGAVLTWRTFVRLEAIDGRGREIALPEWIGRRTGPVAATSVPRGAGAPLWLLLKKELRLQLLPIAVAALYVAACAIGASLRDRIGDVGEAFRIVTVFYGATLAMLIGSIASAEERHLGTLEWHTLLPVHAWKTWTVKIAVLLGLVLSLTAALPIVTGHAFSLMQGHGSKPGLLPLLPVVVIFILFFSVSAYVSSVSTGALQALLISAPATLGTALLLVQPLERLAVRYARQVAPLWISRHFYHVASVRRVEMAAVIALLISAVFIVILLRFAMKNHRSSDHGIRRAVPQVAWLAVCLTIVIVGFAGLEVLLL